MRALIILLGAIIVALIIGPAFFEVADTALIDAGSGFNGDSPPPCRADRVGVRLTLKGVPSVCQQTASGYAWAPTSSQPARVAPAVQPVAPRPASNSAEVCAAPPGRLGQRSTGMYTLASGRTVDGVCTADGWKVAP
jgi:hypothetical protein